MDTNTSCKDNEHSWVQNGYWTGRDPETKVKTGGPMADCSKCNKREQFTWPEWKELPNKKDLEQVKKEESNS